MAFKYNNCECLELPVPDNDFRSIHDTAAAQGLIKSIMRDGLRAVPGYSG